MGYHTLQICPYAAIRRLVLYNPHHTIKNSFYVIWFQLMNSINKILCVIVNRRRFLASDTPFLSYLQSHPTHHEKVYHPNLPLF